MVEENEELEWEDEVRKRIKCNNVYTIYSGKLVLCSHKSNYMRWCAKAENINFKVKCPKGK